MIFVIGRDGGTPLHYATREGLENTIALLLSNGGMSNSIFMNTSIFVFYIFRKTLA